jgi:hypothetical protein
LAAQENPRPIKLKLFYQNDDLKEVIIKPIQFDNQTLNAIRAKFQKIAMMRGSKNPYSLIEAKEFTLNVEKHR